jgi:hypothetical protein
MIKHKIDFFYNAEGSVVATCTCGEWRRIRSPKFATEVKIEALEHRMDELEKELESRGKS